MIRLALKIGVYIAAIWVAVQLVGGLEFTGDSLAWLFVALVMAGVNAVVKPVVKLLSFPAILLTLGLFLIAINIAMFFLVVAISGGLELGLSSDGAGATALGAIVTSIVVWIGEAVIGDD
jgi:putative membrane protein